MKKILIALTVFLLTTSYAAQAQYSYKPFRFDLGMGLSFPGFGTGIGAGVLFGIEPKYSVHPKISLGVRLEFNTLFSTYSNYDYFNNYVDNENFDIRMNGTYLATFDYHFTTSTFRPFIGLGIGLYQLGGFEKESNYNHYNYNNYYTNYYVEEVYYEDDFRRLPSKFNFGGMIRAGFDVTHFRLALEYNYAGHYKENKYSSRNIGFSYFAITVGGYIGGNKIRE